MPPRNVTGSSALKDALVALAVTAVGGAAFVALDAMERLTPTLKSLESLELDDLLLTLTLALAATAWFAGRRVLEAGRALAALRTSERARADDLAKLEALSDQLISTEADTREQLATRVHDGLSQSLYAALLRIDMAEHSSSIDQAHGALQQARDLVTSAMHDARHLTSELHPPSLNDIGLLAALEGAIPEWQRHYGCQITLEPGAAWARAPEASRAALYASLRELAINAAKHANGAAIRIGAALGPHGSELVLQVADTGQGFDPSAPRDGFGLLSVERRLARLGGHMRIRSAPQKGTQVTLTIPIEA